MARRYWRLDSGTRIAMMRRWMIPLPTTYRRASRRGSRPPPRPPAARSAARVPECHRPV